MEEKEMADLTFEQAFQQLEEVVGQLEKGELTLEQSLALFEKGMRLAKLCESKLDEAEQKVSQLAGMSNAGPVLRPFRVEE
ncbi:MAG: exodeoxyribonuclease VII small subunit [Chloroflexi bacterium]|nr:exodeoxyribonuclease VII small subunit [Chloroflexota bacterium]